MVCSFSIKQMLLRNINFCFFMRVKPVWLQASPPFPPALSLQLPCTYNGPMGLEGHSHPPALQAAPCRVPRALHVWALPSSSLVKPPIPPSPPPPGLEGTLPVWSYPNGFYVSEHAPSLALWDVCSSRVWRNVFCSTRSPCTTPDTVPCL